MFTYVSDDFDQAVCCAASVADTLHSREQVWRGITQQHTHLVGLTSTAAHREKGGGGAVRVEIFTTTERPP